MGTDAIIFTGDTTYVDADGQTHRDDRLFIVDSNGGIAPLTESAPHSGHDRDPHWSAALDKVVFATTGDFDPELYAINPNGTGLQQLTDFSGSVRQLRWPVWSPTGDRIVVALHPGPGSNWQLWILDVDLTQSNPITAMYPFKVVDGGGGYVQTAAWAPDGQRHCFFPNGLRQPQPPIFRTRNCRRGDGSRNSHQAFFVQHRAARLESRAISTALAVSLYTKKLR